ASMESLGRKMAETREQAKELATLDSLARDSVAKGLPEIQQELFVLFNESGFPDLYQEYVAGGEVTYWRAAYFLFSHCVTNPARCRTYARGMDRLLELPMAPSSDGFTLYLAAKLNRLLGDNRKADLYLDRLKATRPLMFDFLTRHDDAFDIARLRRRRNGQGP